MPKPTNGRIDALYWGLSAKERLAILLESWREDRPQEQALYASTPPDQVMALNRHLSLVNRHHQIVTLFIEWLLASTGTVAARVETLLVFELWHVSNSVVICELLSDVPLETSLAVHEAIDGGPAWPPPVVANGEEHRTDVSHFCAAVARRAVDELAETWASMLAIEAVVEWLTAEMDGADILHRGTRERLGVLRARLVGLKVALEDVVGAVAMLGEADAEMVEALKRAAMT